MISETSMADLQETLERMANIISGPDDYDSRALVQCSPRMLLNALSAETYNAQSVKDVKATELVHLLYTLHGSRE